jgi:uncharacterized damage-inducible protein DinB
MLKRCLFILSVAALPAAAQQKVAAPAAQKSASSSAGVEIARSLWRGVSGYITQAAADVPETLYSFKPSPDVRTFGELIGHIAGSQKMFCAIAMGEKPPAEDEVEKNAKTKAALVAALKESNDYCARAYQQTDAATSGMVDLFGEKRSKLYTLHENATHDSEHYGNIVTYMRINKMVPPSSRPRSGS